jgi:acyl-coenzyme A synthetase/AMP-(fatty) acid ligase
VRYNEDGSLVFIGRKDTQVKIRGQRIELGEVEQYVLANPVLDSPAVSSQADNIDGQSHSESLKRIAQVVADVVTPNGSDRPMLVVFVHPAARARASEKEHASAVKHAVAGLEERLATQVPVYMVPSACIQVAQMPMTATGKINRRCLRRTYAHSLD